MIDDREMEPEIERVATAGTLDRVRWLFKLLGPFRYDAAAIATLIGVSEAHVSAHHRLGHIVVTDGLIVSLKP